jgi:hypothetical protein
VTEVGDPTKVVPSLLTCPASTGILMLAYGRHRCPLGEVSLSERDAREVENVHAVDNGEILAERLRTVVCGSYQLCDPYI